jgi:predicted small metal-binding protein
MKYMCKSCRKPCNDIIEHIKKVHNFSETYIKDSLKTNSNSYKNSFEEIK